jgi:hypothetical protein
MATVFQAEIYAIGQAAHFLHTNKTALQGIKSIDIITDSKAALQSLDKMCTSSKLVMDCMKTLNQLHTTNVTIHWTKAHVGYEGNEKADTLAKEGTTKISYQVEPIIPVPKSWIKKKIQAYIHREWSNRWLGISEARQTKLFFPQPNAKLSKRLLMYDRPTCAKLFRWISGHSFHRYHNNITNPTAFDDPTCRACTEEREETSHLFAYCKGLAPIRMKVCGLVTFSGKIQWTPTMLLTMIKEIEKICPEEGLPNPQAIDIRPLTLTPEPPM